MSTDDLSTVAGAQAYLAPTQFASTSVTLLCGMHSNFTYRLHLLTPHMGRSTLVMKYARSDIVLSASEILSAMERQVRATHMHGFGVRSPSVLCLAHGLTPE
jgi:hypothetical protein